MSTCSKSEDDPRRFALYRHTAVSTQTHGGSYANTRRFGGSTEIIPTFGLSAGPLVPVPLRGQILAALSALDPSRPAAIAAQVGGPRWGTVCCRVAHYARPRTWYREIRDSRIVGALAFTNSLLHCDRLHERLSVLQTFVCPCRPADPASAIAHESGNARRRCSSAHAANTDPSSPRRASGGRFYDIRLRLSHAE